jgi:hypothetical protein
LRSRRIVAIASPHDGHGVDIAALATSIGGGDA